ncbi:MAG: TIGR04282 family arsenosugar biosynthesis glycosyltransferase [Desulfuromonadales bacterium]
MDKPVETVENFGRQPSFFEETHVLGIFAKEPLPGRVKTRLCPPLSPEQAAALYHTSLVETITRLTTGPWHTVVFYSGDRGFFREEFPDAWLKEQAGGDLGQRMGVAMQYLLTIGQCAILIGSDTPDLPLTHLQHAFAALMQRDFVIAPAADGGYVLVGERIHHPALFRDISWSTPEVLPVTRSRALEMGIASTEVEPWEDMDDLASLQRLLTRSPNSATAQMAVRLMGAATPFGHNGLPRPGVFAPTD